MVLITLSIHRSTTNDEPAVRLGPSGNAVAPVILDGFAQARFAWLQHEIHVAAAVLRLPGKLSERSFPARDGAPRNSPLSYGTKEFLITVGSVG